MVRRAIAMFALAAGCGPSVEDEPVPLEPAELGHVCGQPSPLRILALDPDETLPRSRAAVTRIDDRIYFIIGTGSIVPGGDVFFDAQHVRAETLISTGPCGEDPRIIATGIGKVFTDEHWPGQLLGYHGGDLVVLDPTGQAEPQLLMEGLDLDHWTPDGIVDWEAWPVEGPATLILRPYPAAPGDQPNPIVLGEVPRFHGMKVLEHHAWLSTADDELLHIDLRDDTRTIEAADVEWFDVSPDARFMLLAGPEQEDGIRSFSVFDRQLGTETWLIDSDGLVELRVDTVLIRFDSALEHRSRLVFLPTMQDIQSDDGIFFTERVDAQRWVAWKNPETTYIFDVPSETLTPLVDGFGWFRLSADRLDILRSTTLGVGAGPGTEGPLQTTWLESGRTERVADRARSSYAWLPDDRVLTLVDGSDGDIGTLAVTDGEGHTRWQIDNDVVEYFGRYWKQTGHPDDVVLYSVSDGDRSGLYLARLPPL